MGNLEFREPLFLLAVALAPLAFLLASRRPSILAYSSLASLRSSPRTLKARLTKLPAFLIACSVLLLAIALAGPRTPDAETKVSKEGIAIMMVVDRSSSMNARDLVPGDLEVNRLQVVKDVFRQFVLGGNRQEGRVDDSVGLISFARYADSMCPLTLDHGNLTSILDSLEIVWREDEDGTAIGDGLALAVERLRLSKAKSKVAILLTDGDNNAGVIEPLKAADIAAAHKIKVYCIGAGTNGTAPIPTEIFGRLRFVQAEVRIDEDTLKSIASKTAGKYFRATDAAALQSVYEEIGELERTKITETRYLQYTEHFASFVICGLCLLGLAMLSGATVFRTLP